MAKIGLTGKELEKWAAKRKWKVWVESPKESDKSNKANILSRKTPRITKRTPKLR